MLNNKYHYIDKETNYTLKNNQNEVIFTRENQEIIHTMIFNKQKTTVSIYYLKELHHSLEFNIKTTNLKVTNNKVIINYQIQETNNEYEYIIEMSDIK